MEKINLSLVIPCYNEEKNIPLIIEKLKEGDLLQRKDIEIILVDNGSADKTKKIISAFSKEYPAIRLVTVKKNIGYGFGIWTGLEEAKGEFIGWTHADLQANPLDALKAYNLINSCDDPQKTYVKGKRIKRPLFDKFFTFGMGAFETVYLRTLLNDINAQPNIFHSSFLKLLKDPPKDFSFDLYVYYTAKINNYEIRRFPVIFGKRVYGDSSWNSGLKARIKLIKRTIEFTKQMKKKLV